jgi:hypothetical protein
VQTPIPPGREEGDREKKENISLPTLGLLRLECQSASPTVLFKPILLLSPSEFQGGGEAENRRL